VAIEISPKIPYNLYIIIIHKIMSDYLSQEDSENFETVETRANTVSENLRSVLVKFPNVENVKNIEHSIVKALVEANRTAIQAAVDGMNQSLAISRDGIKEMQAVAERTGSGTSEKSIELATSQTNDLERRITTFNRALNGEITTIAELKQILSLA
jgi:GTP1/Obg family GTP-binding protein